MGTQSTSRGFGSAQYSRAILGREIRAFGRESSATPGCSGPGEAPDAPQETLEGRRGCPDTLRRLLALLRA